MSDNAALADELQKECARVRMILWHRRAIERKMQAYSLMFERDLQAANRALLGHDVAAMTKCHQELGKIIALTAP